MSMIPVLLLFTLVFAILYYKEKAKNAMKVKTLFELRSAAAKEKKALLNKISILEESVALFSKYQCVMDAEKKAGTLVDRANKQADEIIQFAENHAGSLIVTAQFWMDEAINHAEMINQESQEQTLSVKIGKELNVKRKKAFVA